MLIIQFTGLECPAGVIPYPFFSLLHATRLVLMVKYEPPHLGLTDRDQYLLPPAVDERPTKTGYGTQGAGRLFNPHSTYLLAHQSECRPLSGAEASENTDQDKETDAQPGTRSRQYLPPTGPLLLCRSVARVTL